MHYTKTSICIFRDKTTVSNRFWSILRWSWLFSLFLVPYSRLPECLKWRWEQVRLGVMLRWAWVPWQWSHKKQQISTTTHSILRAQYARWSWNTFSACHWSRLFTMRVFSLRLCCVAPEPCLAVGLSRSLCSVFFFFLSMAQSRLGHFPCQRTEFGSAAFSSIWVWEPFFGGKGVHIGIACQGSSLV